MKKRDQLPLLESNLHYWNPGGNRTVHISYLETFLKSGHVFWPLDWARALIVSEASLNIIITVDVFVTAS